MVFESDTTQSLPEFLFRLLRLPSLFATYRRFGEGTVRSSIGFHLLRNVALAIPPKEEQKHILVILDAIDDAIERTEAVIAATECLRNALLHELLTRRPRLAHGVEGRAGSGHDTGVVGSGAAGGDFGVNNVRD